MLFLLFIIREVLLRTNLDNFFESNLLEAFCIGTTGRYYVEYLLDGIMYKSYWEILCRVATGKYYVEELLEVLSRGATGKYCA